MYRRTFCQRIDILLDAIARNLCLPCLSFKHCFFQEIERDKEKDWSYLHTIEGQRRHITSQPPWLASTSKASINNHNGHIPIQESPVQPNWDVNHILHDSTKAPIFAKDARLSWICPSPKKKRNLQDNIFLNFLLFWQPPSTSSVFERKNWLLPSLVVQ